jgi:hypothetical protein
MDFNRSKVADWLSFALGHLKKNKVAATAVAAAATAVVVVSLHKRRRRRPLGHTQNHHEQARHTDLSIVITRDSNGSAGFRFMMATLQVSNIDADREDLCKMRVGDIIVAVNDEIVRTCEEFFERAKGIPQFKLTLRRNEALAGNLRVDQEVVSTTDLDARQGKVRKGDIGIVRGPCTDMGVADKEERIRVDFSSCKNVDILISQVRVEAREGVPPLTERGLSFSGDPSKAVSDDAAPELEQGDAIAPGNAAVDKPGLYVILKATNVSKKQSNSSAYIQRLKVGTEIDVIEIVPVPEEKRLRAKIRDPEGWISLLNLSDGQRWAAPKVGRNS